VWVVVLEEVVVVVVAGRVGRVGAVVLVVVRTCRTRWRRREAGGVSVVVEMVFS
jgi:hypothetical protein